MTGTNETTCCSPRPLKGDQTLAQLDVRDHVLVLLLIREDERVDWAARDSAHWQENWDA